MDLIERQAALDALETTSFDDYGDYRRVRELIEDLPSVQPEIIRCKDCKEFRHRWINTDITFCNRTGYEVKEDDFCGRAERRTDGGLNKQTGGD